MDRDYGSAWPSYGGAFSWSYGGSRFGADFTQTVSSGLDPGSLVAVGIQPARLDSWRLETTGALSYQISPKTGISFGFTYDRTDFENASSLDSSLIVLEKPPFENDLSNVLPEAPEPEETPGEEALPAPPDAQTFILDVIASEGLAAAELSSESVGASFDVRHSISSRTRLSANVYGGYRRFDAISSLALLTNGLGYGASASLSRLLTSRDSVFFLYRMRQNRAQVPAIHQQTATVGWGRTLRQRMPELDVQIQGGLGYLRAPEVSFDDIVPVGDFGLSAKLTRSTSIGARFRSGHNETLGFGRNVRSNYLSAVFSQVFSTRAQLSVNVGYTAGRDLIDADVGSDGNRYGAQLSLWITKGLSFETSYQRVGWQGVSQEASRTSNNLWTVGLSYGHSWSSLKGQDTGVGTRNPRPVQRKL